MHKRELEQIAVQQYGYFTAQQARTAGYIPQNHSYHVSTGNWLSIERGLFRLPGFRDTLESEFVKWAFWVIGRSPTRTATVSHESALFYYQLTQEQPEAIHLTVAFEKIRKEKNGLVIHYGELTPEEVAIQSGYRITSPLRTLKDMRSLLLLQSRWTSTVRFALHRQLIDQKDAQQLMGEPLFQQTVADARSQSLELFDHSNVAMRPELMADGTLAQEPRRSAVMRIPERMHPNQGGAYSFRAESRSFTLVEMLVVVAILTILAGLLMPGLHNALSTARSVTCMNNLSQLHIGNQMYAGNYAWMMPAIFSSTEPYAQNWWSHKIRPFLGDERVPNSWDDSHAFRKDGVLGCPETEPVGTGRATYSYAMNSFSHLVNYSPISLRPAQLTFLGSGTDESKAYAIKPESRSSSISPARILVIGELGADMTLSTGDVHYAIRNNGYFDGMAGSMTYPAFRHREKKNILLLDGHVASVAPGEMAFHLYLK